MKERNRRKEGRECTEKEKRKKRERMIQRGRDIKKRGESERLPNARQNSSVIQQCFIVLSLQMKKGERGVNSKSLVCGRTGVPTWSDAECRIAKKRRGRREDHW